MVFLFDLINLCQCRCPVFIFSHADQPCLFFFLKCFCLDISNYQPVQEIFPYDRLIFQIQVSKLLDALLFFQLGIHFVFDFLKNF